jgi:hypothetical protein
LQAGLKTIIEHQTTGTAEELRSHPEHIKEKVYHQTLKSAPYPWTLPFDLWTVEGDIYLEHLGIPRYQLLDHFPTLTPNDTDYLNEDKTVNAVLGINETERDIILGQSQASPQELWGLSSGASLVAILKNVDTFLKKSGLIYEELKALLRTRFINPSGDVEIEFNPEYPCNLKEAEISPLTKTTLDKILRFTRLKRKLAWSTGDLDMTLRAFQVSEINETFLQGLSHIKRLQTRVNVPLEEMLTWWEI